MLLEEVEKKEVKEIPKKIIGGLAWPEEGNPAFLVLVSEKRQSAEESLEPQIDYLEIIKELEGQTIQELVDQIEDDINILYVSKAAKYSTYIRDLGQWKRNEMEYIQIKPAANSSFESGIMKIKDFIKGNKIRFPEKSKVKEQLKIFSDLSYKTPSSFYAVVALSNAICSIRERNIETSEQEHNIKDWY